MGRECSGTFGPYRYRLDIHEPLARAVVEQGIERGFDLLYTQDAKLDYAFYVPLHFVMPEPALPIVPLHVNVYLPPQPTPARCHAWGVALGEILRARPERVALIASGGMSHFPGTDRYASPEFDYDRGLLDLLREGRGRDDCASPGKSSTSGATSSCARGSPCWARWATCARTCTATSPRGITATRWWNGRSRPHERNRRLLPLPAVRGLPAQPLPLRAQVRPRPSSSASSPIRSRRPVKMGLTDGERADLRRMDRDALVARGAHPYLVFMAGLRLKMAAEPGALAYF